LYKDTKMELGLGLGMGVGIGFGCGWDCRKGGSGVGLEGIYILEVRAEVGERVVGFG